MARASRRARLGLAQLGCLVAVVACGSRVEARGGGNDQPYPVGEHAAGMGGAATAIVEDAAAPWYNPAGLGRVRAEGVSASLSAYGAQFDRTKGFYSMGATSANLDGWALTLFPVSLGYVAPLDVGRSSRFRHAVGVSVVVPDYDRHEVSLSALGAPVTFSAKERLLEQTIWALPAWGACVGEAICFGAAIAFAYRTSNGQYSFYTNSSSDNAHLIGALSVQEDTSQISTAMQAGVQWKVSRTWSFGVDVRSPMRTLWGGGSLLYVDSNYSGTSPTPRQISDESLWTDYRLPLYLRAGAGYQTAFLRLAADVQISFPQDAYASELGQGGANLLQPRATDGTPIGPPINLKPVSRRNSIINASLGVERRLSIKYSFQLGGFTDLSGAPDTQESLDELHPRVNRFGVTGGVIRRSRHSTTHVSLVGTYGIGRSFSLSGGPTQPRYESAAVYLNLGGSSDFTDPDDAKPDTEPSGKPLYARWWFWTLFGGALAGGAIAYIAASSRGTGVPPSNLGAQSAP